MTSPLVSSSAPFGRVLTAMVTPFTADGKLDLDAAQKVASHLVDLGNDGIVVSGTTGESPTTTVAEDGELLRAVLDAIGDRATVIAGVGTNDTRHSVELATQAADAGAHGLLLVTPYYSKPPQRGFVMHVEAVAAAGDGAPIMLYDIPGRTGITIAEDTYLALDRIDEVVAVKDAVGDLERGAWLLSNTGLALYSGDDALNLAWLSVGAAGVVSVVGHAAAGHYRAMTDAVDAGDLAEARRLNLELVPLVRAMMTHTQGAMTAKIALHLRGVLDSLVVRPPLPPIEESDIAIVREGLATAGLLD